MNGNSDKMKFGSESYNYYKQLYEEFMLNNNGSTAGETVLVFIPACVTVFLSTSIITLYFSIFKLYDLKNFLSWKIFFLEYFILVFSNILCFTVASDIVHYIDIFIVILSIFLIIINQYHTKQKIFTNKFFNVLLKSPMYEKKRHFITNFRAMSNLMTAILILAVDFTILPRRFAKTENFGYGLMDTGVGGFVVSNAIVSADVSLGNRKFDSYWQVVIKALKNNMPLIMLGGARYFTTKQIDYQQHITEYGVHWNFFLTLAATKTICTCILALVNGKYSLYLSLVTIGIYQLILGLGIEEWVLSDAPRINMISANREGIASSFGYVAIYLASINIGRLLTNNKSNFEDNVILMVKLIILAIVMWFCTFLTEQWFGVSRRLANVGYYFWTLANCLTILLFLLIVEILTMVLQTMYTHMDKAQGSKKNVKHIVLYVPLTLEAISSNGLLFFLSANILTGLVNIWIHTLKVGTMYSVFIIAGYMLVTCSLTVALYFKSMRLKFW